MRGTVETVGKTWKGGSEDRSRFERGVEVSIPSGMCVET